MEKERLEQLVNIKTGKLNANASDENGIYPFFTCSKETLKINRYSYDCECVLVAGNGDLNAKYYNGKFDAYQRTYILTNKNDKKLNLKYLYYFMQRHLETLRNQSIGGVIKYIKLENLSEAEIRIVSLDEQEKIINKLQKIESIINIRKQQLEKLQILVKSQFVEMFGDPILNDKNWEVKKLKDLSTLIMSGNTPKGGKNVYVDDGILFFRSQNVWRKRLELDDIAYIDEKTNNSMKKSQLKHGDLLITKTGRINTENSSLGRTAIYLGEDGQANINGHVYLVRLNKEVNHDYILEILISKEYREYIRSVCVGGIDKRQLNKEHIEDFPIIYPPIELQKEFTDKVKQIDKQEFEGLKLEKLLKNLIDEGAKNVKF